MKDAVPKENFRDVLDENCKVPDGFMMWIICLMKQNSVYSRWVLAWLEENDIERCVAIFEARVRKGLCGNTLH